MAGFSNMRPSQRAFRQTGVSLTHRPSRRMGIVATSSTLKELEAALQSAVENEDYQEAVTLRDQIKQHPEHDATLSREELQANLKKALSDEDYGAAAGIRDEMAKLPEEKQTMSNAGALSHRSVTVTKGVKVEATSAFIPKRSGPGQFFFVYQIKITNESDQIVHLRNRSWQILDANDNLEEVRGPGVVGQQPVILAGSVFQYVSACPLKTEMGIMEGEFECMVLDEEGEWGDVVQAKVDPFLLTTRVVGEIKEQ